MITQYRGTLVINILYHVATILETHTENLLTLHHIQNLQQKYSNANISFSNPSNNNHKNDINTSLQNFYQQPLIKLKKRHLATKLLYSQLIAKQIITIENQEHKKNNKSKCNYHLFNNKDEQLSDTMNQSQQDKMEEDSPSIQTTTNPHHNTRKNSTVIMKKWETDPTISQLSATFVGNLQEEQEKLCKAGEDMEDVTQYKSPTDATEIPQQQQIRVSLRKARNSDSQPTLKLFKTFAQALQTCDPTLLILLVNAAKQNLPLITSSAKNTAVDINKLQFYFKSYYPNQKTSLSGYIHLSTNLSFEDLSIAPPVFEWLETNHYTMKECPSHDEEMVQIGALCFGSELIYRDDLKKAIQQDRAWQFPKMDHPPIIQLTRGEFHGPKQSKKMIFVQTERTKQHEVAQVFTKIYVGTSKNYPNGNMMLFIPIHDNIKYDPQYRQKVLFNHEQHRRNSDFHSRPSRH